jgi:hypothetical protein
MADPPHVDSLIDEYIEHRGGQAASDIAQPNASDSGAKTSTAAVPPGMQRAKEVSVDELVKQMNRVPLFMTSLDETDGEGGENIELEALKALAYEGTRAEIAANFQQQGNELVRVEKRFRDAREFYTKALHALDAPPAPPDPEQGPSVIEIDSEAELAKELAIKEACLVNRALCNLEMSIYAASEHSATLARLTMKFFFLLR